MIKELTIEEIEKMTQGKYFGTTTLTLVDEALGDNEEHEMSWDIFDGFGYSVYNGKEYYMTFPKKEFIKLASNMDKKIREKLSLADDADITEVDIMQCYNSVYAL